MDIAFQKTFQYSVCTQNLTYFELLKNESPQMYGNWWATFLLRACSGDFMISNSKVSNDNKKRIFAFFIVKFGSQLRCNGALRSAEKRNVALESINTPAGHKIFSKSPMTCNLPLVFRCPLLSTSVHFASPTPYFRGGGFFVRIGRNKTISPLGLKYFW